MAEQRGGRLALSLAAVLAAACALAGPAAAKDVVVGSPLTAKFNLGTPPEEATFFNSALQEPGANVVSPVDGAIVSIGLITGKEPVAYTFKVLRPSGGSVYTAVSSTGPMTYGAGPEPKFSPLRIRRGDTIGIDLGPDSPIGTLKTGPLSAIGSWYPPLAVGSTLPTTEQATGREIAFNATVQPAPTIAAVEPRRSDGRRPLRVAIRGEDFARVKGVYFGSASARYEVRSPRLIIALAPRRSTAARTHVRIKTVAGSTKTRGTSRFAYVPRAR